MNLIFAGTPEFAAYALAALLASRHQEVIEVLTQPDRPAGRGLASVFSPVKRLALERGIPIEQPASLKDALAQEQLRHLRPDAIVVVAYGLILPQAVLDIPRLGAINIHASLLPRWRGAAPIQRALLAGDRETGISIMQMDAGLDTGPVLLREAVSIRDEDTAGSLHDRLAELGARLVVRALDALESGKLKAVPQFAEGATYAEKIDKREARIRWQDPAATVWRQIRAFNPSPGAAARIRSVELKLWQGTPAPIADGVPGEVLQASSDGVQVACGRGSILVTELQRSGAKRLPAREFLRGFPLLPGERFEAGGN
ncbi:MAG: methionyl-tRNA formyltransferase [Burkholderiales bacterium]